jgi:hypothetical protein
MMLDGVQQLITDCGVGAYATAVGHPHWWVLQIPDPVHQTLVQQILIDEGVLGSNGSHFVSLAHTEEIVRASLDAYAYALSELNSAIANGTAAQQLRCPANLVTFRRS